MSTVERVLPAAPFTNLRATSDRDGRTQLTAASTPRTPSRITWQNLGWRLGFVLGATSPELIERIYRLCVQQQAEANIPRA
ncbi:MAG: hypothetical protein WD598_01010 [Acidimicrobiia bacterium]